MGRVSLDGRRVTDERTLAALKQAERISGEKFLYAQGSYNGGVNASGTTHHGGGAVDIRTIPLKTMKRKLAVVKALRRVGFAAWFRPVLYVRGKLIWGEHIHAILIQPGGKSDQGVLSSSAWWQVKEYYLGKNGLVDRKPDPHRNLKTVPRTFEAYKKAAAAWRSKQR